MPPRHTAIWRLWHLLKPNHIGRRSGVNAALRKIFDNMSDLDGLQCEGAKNFNRGCTQIFSLHNFRISAFALYEDCFMKVACEKCAAAYDAGQSAWLPHEIRFVHRFRMACGVSAAVGFDSGNGR